MDKDRPQSTRRQTSSATYLIDLVADLPLRLRCRNNRFSSCDWPQQFSLPRQAGRGQQGGQVMGRLFKNILETVGNTPVVKINRLAPPDVNLYVKIEASNPLGSVKDRLALGGIEAAERPGELKPGQTVVEATSGNTGIGLAMVCAQKGYPLVVTMT